MAESDKLKEVFKEEAYELLTDLETALLELEEAPTDQDLIGRVFRAMHTIKGSGSMCGYKAMAGFTHEVETVFDLVRSGRIKVDQDLINLTLVSRDLIKTMLEAQDGEGAVDDKIVNKVITSLKGLVPRAGQEAPPRPASAGGSGAKAADAPKETTYRIKFKPPPEIFKRGTNPELLLQEVRELGDCHILAIKDPIPTLDDFDPELCYTSWDILLTTDRGENAVRDIFIFVDDAELKLEVVDSAHDGGIDLTPLKPKLGAILVERGDASPETIHAGLAAQKKLGQILVETGTVTADRVASALVEQEHVKEVKEKRHREEAAASVRVPAARLDKLVDLVGELVTVQARLTQSSVVRPEDAGLRSIAEEVDRLTAELRDNVMSIRMLPIGTTFSRFKRLVRDLSAELGKEIELTTEGAETELDKTVIERLGDPLVHLIRNSIDHGIEPPDAREAAGKPRHGTIHLSAVHSGASVLIRIVDDGAGIDVEAVRRKAVDKGLVPPEVILPEREAFALLFEPGFSTARNVTNVSGRGVGMDVVKKTIQALRGSIELSSRKGQGATITLMLPLTLAIIDGFLTQVAAERFIFPLSLVEECVELGSRDRIAANGRHLVNVRGQLVPYVRLRELFRIGGDPFDIEQIVITRVNDRRVGFVVDEVIGSHQTVIKNLGRYYQNVEGVSGATILGDGTVALIIDAPKLASLAEERKATVNCWEFKKCGREANGANAKTLSICPAYPAHGKSCARVAGTLCNGSVQGTFAKKLGDCLICDFYQSVNYG